MKFILKIIFFFLISNDVIAQQSDIILEKGLNLFRKGDLVGADSLIDISINMDRNIHVYDYMKYYNKGAVQLEMNKFDVALKYLDSALMLKNDFYPALENKAWCKFGLKDYEGALLIIDICMKIAPKYIEVYSLGVNISLVSKNYSKAKIYCDSALKIASDPRFYFYNTVIDIKQNRDYKLVYQDLIVATSLFGKNEINISEAWIYYSFAFKYGDLCKLINEYEEQHGKLDSILKDERFDKSYKECVNKKSEIKTTH